MALYCDVVLDSGLPIQDAFLKIQTFSGTENHVTFNLYVYINKAAYEDGKSAVTELNYGLEFDKDINLFRQMYEYLRSLPEYSEATES